MLLATTTSGGSVCSSAAAAFSGTAEKTVGWSSVSARRIRRPSRRWTPSSAGRTGVDRRRVLASTNRS